MRWGNIMTIRLTTEEAGHLFRSRFVFVCNNPAELEYFNLPGRQCIDADKFAVYVPRLLSPPGIVRLGFRMLGRRAQESRDFETFCARDVSFEIKPSRVPVSLDGEVEIMQSPLHYRLRPGALRIRLPPATQRRNQSDK
jgi:diacylglycerol kinase family enzyme